MSYLKTSSKTIKRDAERIKELTDSIPKLVDELKDALLRLDGCWEGSAWNQYQNTNAENIEILQDIYKYYVEYVANMQILNRFY